jgi:hypothetical protein
MDYLRLSAARVHGRAESANSSNESDLYEDIIEPVLPGCSLQSVIGIHMSVPGRAAVCFSHGFETSSSHYNVTLIADYLGNGIIEFEP